MKEGDIDQNFSLKQREITKQEPKTENKTPKEKTKDTQ